MGSGGENMNYSRRDFMRVGGLALGLIPLFSIPAFGKQDVSDSSSLFQSIETFRDLLGSEFTFYRADSAAIGVLSEVIPFESAKKSSASFSMVFELSREGFPQETYEVFNPAIGKFELFAVPGLSKKGVPLLIAVVNSV